MVNAHAPLWIFLLICEIRLCLSKIFCYSKHENLLTGKQRYEIGPWFDHSPYLKQCWITRSHTCTKAKWVTVWVSLSETFTGWLLNVYLDSKKVRVLLKSSFSMWSWFITMRHRAPNHNCPSSYSGQNQSTDRFDCWHCFFNVILTTLNTRVQDHSFTSQKRSTHFDLLYSLNMRFGNVTIHLGKYINILTDLTLVVTEGFRQNHMLISNGTFAFRNQLKKGWGELAHCYRIPRLWCVVTETNKNKKHSNFIFKFEIFHFQLYIYICISGCWIFQHSINPAKNIHIVFQFMFGNFPNCKLLDESLLDKNC